MEFEGRDIIVKKVQRLLNLKDDGQDGIKTWTAILSKLLENHAPVDEDSVAEKQIGLSDNAMKLILEFEVGGGEAYYNKCLKHPTYPGGASGVTIGIGYDLGYNDSFQFNKDWSKLLDIDIYARLSKVLGLKGSKALDVISIVKDITIDWEDALTVFKTNTIPRFIDETLKAFPGADKLHPDAFGALVSLVFNRGSSVTGTNRSEMMNIRNLIQTKDYKKISQEILNMKKIWAGKGLDGLLRRRDAEAEMIRKCA